MDGLSDAGSSFADVATTASGLMLQTREQPEGLGSSAEDLAFAKFKLPQQRVVAVFRPDLDEAERVSWSLVNYLARTPCLWPCCCVVYPWLVGCARYNVKALHETLYVATEEGVITLVNNVDKAPLECLAPRVEPAFRRWSDIAEVRTKDIVDARGKELGGHSHQDPQRRGSLEHQRGHRRRGRPGEQQQGQRALAATAGGQARGRAS